MLIHTAALVAVDVRVEAHAWAEAKASPRTLESRRRAGLIVHIEMPQEANAMEEAKKMEDNYIFMRRTPSTARRR